MLNRSTKKNANSNDWKSKYSGIAKKLSQKEREWAKVEELLRRTIRRLTIAANGVHPVLDQRLTELRNTMDKHLDLNMLQQVSDSMPDTLRQLSKETEHQLTPTKVLIKLAEQLQNIESVRKDADKLRALLQHDPDQDELQSIIGQFGDLLSKPQININQTTSSSANVSSPSVANDTDTINLINTFVSNLDFPEISNTELMSIQARSSEASSEIRKELAIELTTLLNKAGANLEAQIQPQSTETYKPADVILLLIELLSFPESLQKDVNNIRSRLEKPLTEEEWPRLLKVLANIVERARNQVQKQKHELENFLSELTDRIELMDMNVSGLSEVREQAMACSDAMQKNVTKSVEGIHESMSSHSDIEQLRASVFGQLDGLREHVSGYQVEQNNNNSKSEQIIGELSKKLESMEGETQILRKQVKQQREKATIDPLTNTSNRLAFDERIATEFARWKRDKKAISLIVWDADHFKLVNDTFGHLAGDKVLRLIADTLNEYCRESDFVARYGGEEFVMILPGADCKAAFAMAESIRKAIETSNFSHDGKPVPITLSAGIAEFETNDKPESVFARADAALYEAKRHGRNRCQLATASTSIE